MDEKALYYISYGMYVVSSVKGESFNGQIANSIMQIDNGPVTVAVSINKKNLTHEYIEESSIFSVSVLAKETPLRFIGKFGFQSGRLIDKFKGHEYEKFDSGCPVVVENAICGLGAKVVNKMECGAYTLFLGEVNETKIYTEGVPMTYAFYHEEKCGATPESAPTFSESEDGQKVCGDLPKYRCTVCNYIYNPSLGDPDGGVPPGTLFEDIPEDWTCPVCGVNKSKFEKVE